MTCGVIALEISPPVSDINVCDVLFVMLVSRKVSLW